MSTRSNEHGSRLFNGPRFVEVYVFPRLPSHPDDIKRDLPPWRPPVVRYMGVEANYWLVLDEGKMPYMGAEKVFSPEVMDWLRQIEPDVEAELRE
jgi:hypothetical protein